MDILGYSKILVRIKAKNESLRSDPCNLDFNLVRFFRFCNFEYVTLRSILSLNNPQNSQTFFL
jgi:hypothetical protein